MFQNWYSLSPNGLVTPSIGIPTKHAYSIVHYLSNKHPQTSVPQIDLELQFFLWKQLHVTLQRIIGGGRIGPKNQWERSTLGRMGSVRGKRMIPYQFLWNDNESVSVPNLCTLLSGPCPVCIGPQSSTVKISPHEDNQLVQLRMISLFSKGWSVCLA